MKKSVYIVDDHDLFSKSLEMLINQFESYQVTFCGKNGRELVFKLQDNIFPKPDIILLDVNMPLMNGLESMNWLMKNYPNIPVIVLTMQDDENIMLEMLKLGVKGYLLKDISPKVLEKALNDVLNFGFSHSEKMTKAMIGALSGKSSPRHELKDKEIIFLKLICTERTYKEIADIMNLSPKTIDGYRESLFEKLDVKSRVGLVVYSIKNGIFQLD